MTGTTVPALVAEMVASYPGDPLRARELHAEIRAVAKALFLETNPCPVKHAMAELGLIERGELRLPLVEVTERTREAMRPAIERMRELIQ